jgi:hypothetical protein
MELLKSMVINRLYGGGSTLHGGRDSPRTAAKPAAQTVKSGA